MRMSRGGHEGAGLGTAAVLPVELAVGSGTGLERPRGLAGTRRDAR